MPTIWLTHLHVEQETIGLCHLRRWIRRIWLRTSCWIGHLMSAQTTSITQLKQLHQLFRITTEMAMSFILFNRLSNRSSSQWAKATYHHTSSKTTPTISLVIARTSKWTEEVVTKVQLTHIILQLCPQSIKQEQPHRTTISHLQQTSRLRSQVSPSMTHKFMIKIRTWHPMWFLKHSAIELAN